MGFFTTDTFFSRWLRSAHPFWFSLTVALMAFCCYTCVFALRKVFTVATFEGMVIVGVSYKVWMVIFQMLGYGAAKFFGIKFISELKPEKRAVNILLMCSLAVLSWLFFAMVPSPYNIFFLFTNGFPLGMVWGMVFGYLEGRRVTEVLGAGLATSFIFASGFAQSIGGYVMRDGHVPEAWMPFVTTTLFMVPLVVFLWLLNQTPPPSTEDEAMRTKRRPMSGEERKSFLRSFWPGIVLFVLAYMMLTAFRDFRDNFSAEVWKSLGYGNSPNIYTRIATPISIAVMVIMGSVMMVRDNKKALVVNHLIILAGMVLVGVSTYLFEKGMMGPTGWMVLMGLGLYMGYVPFNSIFFDRLIATFQYVSTVGFIMYVADAFGYLGSMGVMFFKEFGYKELSWLDFFIQSGYFLSLTGSFLIVGSMAYFSWKHKRWFPLGPTHRG